jgi:hypothetical protein
VTDGFLREDLEPRIVSGPPRYSSRTEKAVEHVALANAQGAVIGWFYANDEDDAAGWVARPRATPEDWNLATPWARMLHDAKKRGLRPTQALDEMLRAGAHALGGRVVPGSRRMSPSLAALRQLAPDGSSTA